MKARSKKIINAEFVNDDVLPKLDIPS